MMASIFNISVQYYYHHIEFIEDSLGESWKWSDSVIATWVLGHVDLQKCSRLDPKLMNS